MPPCMLPTLPCFVMQALMETIVPFVAHISRILRQMLWSVRFRWHEWLKCGAWSSWRVTIVLWLHFWVIYAFERRAKNLRVFYAYLQGHSPHEMFITWSVRLIHGATQGNWGIHWCPGSFVSRNQTRTMWVISANVINAILWCMLVFIMPNMTFRCLYIHGRLVHPYMHEWSGPNHNLSQSMIYIDVYFNTDLCQCSLFVVILYKSWNECLQFTTIWSPAGDLRVLCQDFHPECGDICCVP